MDSLVKEILHGDSLVKEILHRDSLVKKSLVTRPYRIMSCVSVCLFSVVTRQLDTGN